MTIFKINKMSTNSIQKDVIIIGQGIAGSVLAMSYIKLGYSVLVIDNSELSQSSKVAAGIWNPVVFKRLTKSWLADELVSELIFFYQWAETILNKSFVHHRSIIKAFGEEQEIKFWCKKAETDNPFLDSELYTNLRIDENTTIENYSKVLQAGYINLPIFLNETKKYLKYNNCFLDEIFDYKALTHTTEGVNYKGISAKRIVFCEGYNLSQNPYFNYIALKPAKGEVLTIKCEHFMWQESIINKGFFILPLGGNLYKVGATYEWNELNDIPSEERKLELCKKLEALISVPYQIIKHEAGVRPSSNDRRPIIGAHPEFKNYFIFNGLGTKGVMLAPYFALQLINYTENNDGLNSEVDVKRFEIK